MRSTLALWAGVALLAGMSPTLAAVDVAIDLTNQRMHVTSSRGTFDWPISSARSGFYTPGGSFAPTHLERMHYSKKYHMSPMPHSIFFRGGFAIHGTYSTAELGRPASHGCVRLSPDNAATLYSMVNAEGARISIHGTPPVSRPFPRTYYADRELNSGGPGYDDVPYTSTRMTRRPYRGDEDDGGGYEGLSAPFPTQGTTPLPFD